MKKSKILILFFAVALSAASSSSLFAQTTSRGTAPKAKGTEKTIKPFAANRGLSADDIGFLNMVSGSKTRGANSEVTVSGKKFKAGDKLTEADVTLIKKAVDDYSNAHPPKKADKSRGAGGWCPGYTCYWVDGYGVIWYYCC